MRRTFKKGDGIHFRDWPGHSGGAAKSSLKHCPICAECTAMKCYNDSREHTLCGRHYRMTDKLMREDE